MYKNGYYTHQNSANAKQIKEDWFCQCCYENANQ